MIIEKLLYQSASRREAYGFPLLRLERLEIGFVYYAERVLGRLVEIVVKEFMTGFPDAPVGYYRSKEPLDVFVFFFRRKFVNDFGKCFHNPSVRILCFRLCLFMNC